jgi:hypothetical protein
MEAGIYKINIWGIISSDLDKALWVDTSEFLLILVIVRFLFEIILCKFSKNVLIINITIIIF